MNYLSLDVANVRKNCENTKQAIAKYEENMTSYFKNLMNVDASWKDKNTSGFVHMVGKDQAQYTEQSQNMKKNITCILDFCDRIESIFNSNLGVGTLINLKYLPQVTENAKNYLDECTKGINDLKRKFSAMYVPASSGYSSIIHSYLNDLDDGLILKLKNKINDTVTELSDAVNSSKDRIDGILFTEMDPTLCKARYRVAQVGNLQRLTKEKEKPTRVYSQVVENTFNKYDISLEDSGNTRFINEEVNLEKFSPSFQKDETKSMENSMNSNIAEIDANTSADKTSVTSKNVETNMNFKIELEDANTSVAENNISTNMVAPNINLESNRVVSQNNQETIFKNNGIQLEGNSEVSENVISSNMQSSNIEASDYSKVNSETVRTNISAGRVDVTDSSNIIDILDN